MKVQTPSINILIYFYVYMVYTQPQLQGERHMTDIREYQQKFKNDCISRVRHTVEELTAVTDGRMWYCPCCEALVSEERVREVDGRMVCLDCDGEVEVETASMLHVFEDVFDVEYRVGSPGDDHVRSVKVLITMGGPNIWVDTGSDRVVLSWGHIEVTEELPERVSEAINAFFDEEWRSQRY
jgi:hypothetical protein